jgi:lipid A 4'-phosphatase
MTYLGRRSTRHVLWLFSASALLLAWFPALDLRVSSLFHRDGGFHLARSWWVTILHESVGYFLCLAVATVVALYVFNRASGLHLGRVTGMTVSYLLLVLGLGAGLIVNVILKDGFGRARPRNVIEFGGSQKFSSAFQASAECTSNCSFPSGDSSGAFFALALAFAFGRKRAAIAAAAAYGALVSFSRVAAGAHFLSDIVVSFVLMWITADVLYYFMLKRRRAPGRIALPAAQPQRIPERGVRGVESAPSPAGAAAEETLRGSS